MRVYLSGPITGMPNLNREAFAAAEKLYKDKGFDVVNPLAIVPPGCDWSDAMDICIHELFGCDMVAMLDGWQGSIGARIEHAIAHEAFIGIVEVEDDN